MKSRWSAATALASGTVLAALLLIGAPMRQAAAEDAPPPAADGAATPAPAGATEAEAPAEPAFSQEELRKLLAPFALYPDALLAQLLPASAYPIDIVQAARWLDKNEAAVKKGDFSGADDQAWDASVKALVRFPDVIQKLNADLDVTTDLGDAFVNQPEDVAAMIQTLRAEAQKGGSLKSTKQQTVTVQQQGSSSYIVIQPTDPEVIYVPTYDPATVYYDSSYGSNFVYGALGFGVGVAVGVAIDNVWDWNRGWVYPPRWPGYPGYRPGYPGYGGRPGNVNIGNEINIGGNNNINIGNGNTRPWRPDTDKYRPGQGSKPGLADRSGAGNGKRPGGNAAGNKLTNKPDIKGGALGDKGGNLANKGGALGDKGGNLANKGGALGDKGGNLANKGGGLADKGGNLGNKGGGLPDKGNIGNKAAGIDKGSIKKPAQAAKPAMKAQKPAVKKPAKPTAFGDAKLGGASNAMAQRGAASRNFQRPSGGGGGAAMHRGGGGGGGAMRGGGGGGGGRRR